MDLVAIQDPYASVWVAVYEPLVVEWISGLGVRSLFEQVVKRELASARTARRPRVLDSDDLPYFAFDERRAAQPPTGLAARSAPTGAPQLQERVGVIRQAFERSDLPGILEGLQAAGVPVALDSRIRRELSPLGIVHFYRQLYFDAGAGMGPIETLIAVAPLETLEVLERRIRRRTYERIEQHGLEQTSESSVEEQVLDEISETVQASIATDISVGISSSAEGTVGVISGSASATMDLATSTAQARETARRRMVGQTRRSAETVRRTMSVSVRTQEEVGEEYSVRRLLRNEGGEPVNYALRRVLRRVHVKLQSMGPRLAWQLYLCAPGRNLIRSRMVMFPESQPITTPDLPPDAPPRPAAADESATQTVGHQNGVITLTFPDYADRVLKGVVINDVMDASPEGKDPTPPVLLQPATVANGDAPTSAQAGVSPGSARRILVHYTAHFEPSVSTLAQWSQQVAAARQNYQAQQLEQQFEGARRLIEARRAINPRPAADLREEERYEILRRMVEEGFGPSGGQGPAPVEIELFHRYFEIGSMFYYVHPSWWRPRYGNAGEEYEITESSRPAAFGSSLGWALQLDGDRRRNELLNSPWVRVCIPIKPGEERAACTWLAEHVEGKKGLSLAAGTSAGQLLELIEARREGEGAAAPGPDFVTLDGQVAPGRELAAETWPVIDDFEILQPTEGFVYERVHIA